MIEHLLLLNKQLPLMRYGVKFHYVDKVETSILEFDIPIRVS